MRCPGQDWSYWTGEVAFEAPCPKCDAAVEFFKDETSGRCPKCGHRFRNPRFSFDCAQWCSFAEECLGFVPDRQEASDPGQGALAGRLIRAIKDEFDSDQARIARALMVFRQASELLSKEGGDPRIIVAAALLLEIGTDRPRHVGGSADVVAGSADVVAGSDDVVAGSDDVVAGLLTEPHSGVRDPRRTRGLLTEPHSGVRDPRLTRPPGETPATAKARQILEDVGLDHDTTDCVCHVLDSRRMGKQLDTIEFRVVSDSEFLAKLAAAKNAGGNPDRLLELAEGRLKTESGKQRARRLL